MAADYVAFGDVPRTLVQGGVSDTTFSFRTENVDASKVASVDYLVDPNGFCVYQLEVNGTVIHQAVSLDTGNAHAMRENFDIGLLNDGDNELRVTLTGGTANMVVSDGVVHFKTL